MKVNVNVKKLYHLQNASGILGLCAFLFAAVGISLADSYSLVPMAVCVGMSVVCAAISYIFWVEVQRGIKRYQRFEKRLYEKAV